MLQSSSQTGDLQAHRQLQLEEPGPRHALDPLKARNGCLRDVRLGPGDLLQAQADDELDDAAEALASANRSGIRL